MTRDFFERRTGFKPTETEWAVIRSEYTRGMEDPGDFCDRFVREEKPKEWGESRGMIIECMYSMYLAQRRYYEDKLAAKEQEAAEAIANLSGKVAALQEALDRELGWKLAEGVGTHMISIHAPRVGCDLSAPETDELEDISIHAPRVGCDQEYRQGQAGHGISIHAPRVGCDGYPLRLSSRKCNFNPRTPCGVRQRGADAV